MAVFSLVFSSVFFLVHTEAAPDRVHNKVALASILVVFFLVPILVALALVFPMVVQVVVPM